MRFNIIYCLWHCFWHHFSYVHTHNYLNMTWYELLLFDNMTWFTLCNQFKLNTKNHKKTLLENNKHVLLEICQIKIKSFYILAWKQDHEIFAVIMKNIKKVLNLKLYVNSWLFVLKKYHDLINVFEKKKADKLTSYWEKYDIEINLKSNKMSNFESLYSMSQKELQVLHEYLDEQLAKKFI